MSFYQLVLATHEKKETQATVNVGKEVGNEALQHVSVTNRILV